MTSRFIVRSEHQKPLTFKTICYDGVRINTTIEKGIPVFGISSDDVIIELVVRRKQHNASRALMNAPTATANDLAAVGLSRDLSLAGTTSYKNKLRETLFGRNPIPLPPSTQVISWPFSMNVPTAAAANLSQNMSLPGSTTELTKRLKETFVHNPFLVPPATHVWGGDAAANGVRLATTTPWKCTKCQHVNEHIRKRCKECKGWRGGTRFDIRNDKIFSTEAKEVYEDDDDDELKLATPNEQRWYARYHELVVHKRQTGSCKLSPEDSLYKWMQTQRERLRLGKLSHDKIERLREIGLVWDKTDENQEVLTAHKKQTGSCKVSLKENDKQLEFVSLSEQNWQARYEELIAHEKRTGSCKVSLKDNRKLHKWVQRQHACFKEGKLSHHRIAKLREVGWVSQDNSWESRFSELLEYKRLNGSLKIPTKHKLYKWANDQRIHFKKGTISELHLSKLNEVGFPWSSALDTAFNKYYSDLVLFKQKYGHCMVPRTDKRYAQLAEWVCGRRKDFKNGILSEERTAKLNALGFTWVARRVRYKLDDAQTDNNDAAANDSGDENHDNDVNENNDKNENDDVMVENGIDS